MRIAVKGTIILWNSNGQTILPRKTEEINLILKKQYFWSYRMIGFWCRWIMCAKMFSMPLNIVLKLGYSWSPSEFGIWWNKRQLHYSGTIFLHEVAHSAVLGKCHHFHISVSFLNICWNLKTEEALTDREKSLL